MGTKELLVELPNGNWIKSSAVHSLWKDFHHNSVDDISMPYVAIGTDQSPGHPIFVYCENVQEQEALIKTLANMVGNGLLKFPDGMYRRIRDVYSISKKSWRNPLDQSMIFAIDVGVSFYVEGHIVLYCKSEEEQLSFFKEIIRLVNTGTVG